MIATSLQSWVFAGAMVFARVGGAIMPLPGLGDASVPRLVRLGVAVSVTVLLTPLLLPDLPAQTSQPFALTLVFARETAIGLGLGWLARTLALILPQAGQIISYQIGLSSVLLTSETMGSQSTVLANAFGIALPALLFSTRLISLPLIALKRSYEIFPPAIGAHAASAVSITATLPVLVHVMALSFDIAVRLAAPFVIAGLVWQAALAFLARAVPQMQVFFVGAPMQIIGGLALLGSLLIAITEHWSSAVLHILHRMVGG